jgi:hypothetical protein
MPLHFSDAQIDMILAAAQPLARDQRTPFLEAVAKALDGQETPGDGQTVSRDPADAAQVFRPAADRRCGLRAAPQGPPTGERIAVSFSPKPRPPPINRVHLPDPRGSHPTKARPELVTVWRT